MKKIKILGIALVTATASFVSCGDDFLTVYPPASEMYVDAYKTESDITAGLAAAYAPLLWESYSWGYILNTFMSDIMSDDLYPGGPNAADTPSLQKLEDFSITHLQQPDGWWTLGYSGVNRCQHVIENLPNVEGLSTGTYNRIMSEALFLRCYYYYNLWKFWGNIPYYELNLTYPYTTPQLTADEVYEKCVTVLDEIISGKALPEVVPTAELGRATHAAAQMLKARFVMYQMDESRFASVLADMQDIISKGHYDLKTTTLLDVSPAGNAITPFEELFMREGEWCEETIFDINHTDYGSLTGWSSPPAAGGTVFSKLIGPRELSSNEEFDAGWGFATVPVASYDMYDDADTRKDGGILNFDKWADQYAAANNVAKPTRGAYAYEQVTGFYLKKYIARKGYNVLGPGTGSGDMGYSNNIRIFRYAETLLNAAELILRTGGNATTAQGYLDRIRDRAYGDTGHRIDATINNIMSERRKEFLGEGLRYWDLVRTGQANTLPDWTASKKYWPIPNAEMNNTAGTDHPLVQNPY